MAPETWPLPRIHWLPPCIIGPQASSTIGRLVGRGLLGQLLDRVERRAEPAGVQRRPDDVLVAPDHALRVAGGAAGVEHVVVVGLRPAEPLRRRGGQRGVVLLAQHDHVLERAAGRAPATASTCSGATIAATQSALS